MLKKEVEFKSPRKAYGETLVELGKNNKDIVVLDADLSSSTQTKMFKDAYPDRFFNSGIAEQDMMTTALGLSLVGKIPFVSTFAMFATARCLDQIRNSICYQKANVKIVATHGGVTVGEDGSSHQALEDISFMRSLPNMAVIVPVDYKEVEEVIKFALNYQGPMYIRLSRTNTQCVFDDDYKFDLNHAVKIKDGKDLTILSNGETTIEVIKAIELFENANIDVEVLHVPTIKPYPILDVLDSIKKTKKVVTVENHSIIGGLGSSTCEVLSENYPVSVLRIGTNDVFGQSGNANELVKYYGLDSQGIFNKVQQFIKEKQG